MLQLIKSCLTSLRPNVSLAFAQQLRHWLCYLGEILDKLPAIAGKSKKTPQLFDILWRSPLLNSPDSVWVNCNALLRNYMAKKVDLIEPKLTLGELGIELVISQLLQHQSEMLLMLFLCLGEDKDAVEVEEYEHVEPFLEQIVHGPHERRRSV